MAILGRHVLSEMRITAVLHNAAKYASVWVKQNAHFHTAIQTHIKHTHSHRASLAFVMTSHTDANFMATGAWLQLEG